MIKKKIRFITFSRRKFLILLFLSLIVVISIISSLILKSTAANLSKGISILIDPGHGGIDGGTNDGASFLEKDINLQISKKLKDLLIADKFKVDLTRETDVSLDNLNNASSSRHIRDLVARVMQINCGKYDIFISIHVDYSTNSNASGQLVFYSLEIPESVDLARFIQSSLNQHMKPDDRIEVDKQPMTADLFILENSSIPGVLIETGFISNQAEKKLLQTENYQIKLAKAIHKGIVDYINYRFSS